MAKFSELSATIQIGIVIGLLAILSGAAYWFLYKDMHAANDTAMAAVTKLEKENAELRPYADRKADMERRIATLQDQLAQMRLIVPDEKEAPQFMEMIQAEARKAGIQVRRYTAQPTSTREFFTESPWTLELDGPYYSMLHFFEDVAHLARIVNITNLKMATVQRPGDSGVKKQYTYAPGESVVASCTATTFFSKNPATPAPAAAGARKQ